MSNWSRLHDEAGGGGTQSVNQFAQIAYHQMRAMLLQLLGSPLARDADHKSEVSVRSSLDSRDGILDDNRPRRLNAQ